MSSPRLLSVHLGSCAPGGQPRAAWGEFVDPDPALARLGAASGEALALALLLGRARRAGPAHLPFVLAVGDAVRRGLPTAARATLAARSPLSGLFADGQVGGDLGRRLARLCAALVLEGSARASSVLLVGADGSARLEQPTWEQQATPAQRIAALEERFGPCAALVVGPAAERGLAFANLASGRPPSFVGRGGLGAALHARGLVGLCLQAEPVADAPDGELSAVLLDSPRLRARGEGGSLELLHAFAARGDLGDEDGAGGARLAREAQAAARVRHGCRGCPTPGGWVFETGSGATQGARFNGVQALGVELGLASFEDSLQLLVACDAAGVDAREAGALLALALAAQDARRLPGSAPRGDVAGLLGLLERVLRDPRARGGAAGFARELQLADAQPRARGQVLRPERSLAALLGQCVSARGADPMRSASHVLLDAGDRARLAELIAPLALPPGAEDPALPIGKGRLVAFSEALSAAVDATGFCAFSAGALLADGLVTLDDLGRRILPDGTQTGAPGRRLLALGASLALAARELEQHLGAQPDVDRPAFAAQRLGQPGMWDEYRRLRGLDAAGRPRPEALALLGDPALLDLGCAALEESPAAVLAQQEASAGPAAVRRAGTVGLRAVGPLGQALGALGPQAALGLALPAPLSEVLATLAAQVPEAAPQLGRGGRTLALVYRAGRRLALPDAVHDGDVLDLVVAIGGG